jgi:hypothetical protein
MRVEIHLGHSLYKMTISGSTPNYPASADEILAFLIWHADSGHGNRRLFGDLDQPDTFCTYRVSALTFVTILQKIHRKEINSKPLSLAHW